MAWKTACLLVNQGPPGYLGGFPRLSRNKVRSVLTGDLGLSFSQSKLTSFDLALCPPASWFGFGVYEQALICVGHDELYGWVESPAGSLVTTLLSRYQSADVLIFEVASATGYFAFAYFEEGNLLRSMAGDPERGIVVDTNYGESKRLDFFPVTPKTKEEAAIKGEGIVFDLTRSFFGVPLSQFAAEKLNIELIKKGGLLSRLFSRV